MHPDFEEFKALSAEERLIHSMSNLLRHFGPRVIDDLTEGFPKVDGPPGLRAVVSPERVVVRVLAGCEDDHDVRRIVLADIAQRYVCPELKVMIDSGYSPGDVDVAAHEILLRVKGQYAVERLGDSPPGSGT